MSARMTTRELIAQAEIAKTEFLLQLVVVAAILIMCCATWHLARWLRDRARHRSAEACWFFGAITVVIAIIEIVWMVRAPTGEVSARLNAVFGDFGKAGTVQSTTPSKSELSDMLHLLEGEKRARSDAD